MDWHPDQFGYFLQWHEVEAALAVEAVRPETDIDEERLARALREVQPPDPIWAENAAAASGMTVNWNGWAAALIAAYRATPLAERP